MSEPVNLPFERVPQCGCDPGTGPVPRNAEIFALRAEVIALKRVLEVRNARIEQLEAAAKAVEDWWVSDGIHHFVGAPYAIFAIRAALANSSLTKTETKP